MKHFFPSVGEILQNSKGNKPLEQVSSKVKLQGRKSKQLSERTIEKRVERVMSLSNSILKSEETFERTEAFRLAKLVAITSLPKRKTKKRDYSKVFRLGKNLWAKVTLSTKKDGVLPYGEDRFVLAGIMHLAIEQNNPVVFFKTAGKLLDIFEVKKDGRSYKRLRNRVKRISDVSIYIQYGRNRKEVEEGNIGEDMKVVYKFVLPSKQDIQAEIQGQERLNSIYNDPELNDSPYGVRFSWEFWEYLKDPKHHIIIPIDLLKLFIDQPTGWDYALFLTSRCYSARTSSIIEHETLIELFKEGKEEDRQTIDRLKKYHAQIMLATNDRLNAKISEHGYFPQKGRGRRKKKWKLCVGPSKKIIWSGKKPGRLPIKNN